MPPTSGPHYAVPVVYGVYEEPVNEAQLVHNLAANPHLKLVLGYPPETIEREVRPFDASRFADEQARTAFLDRLSSAGSVADYLLRLRRADGSAVWLEVTATADPADTTGAMRIEALVRDVSERKHLEDQSRDLYYQLLYLQGRYQYQQGEFQQGADLGEGGGDLWRVHHRITVRSWAFLV